MNVFLLFRLINVKMLSNFKSNGKQKNTGNFMLSYANVELLKFIWYIS